eukprot:8910372-Lingulodinium_polyedra.AAC.1
MPNVHAAHRRAELDNRQHSRSQPTGDRTANSRNASCNPCGPRARPAKNGWRTTSSGSTAKAWVATTVAWMSGHT